MQTSLSKKGYHVPKKELTKEKLLELTSDLLVTPKEYDEFKKNDDKDPSFKVYNEDDEYLYIPKYYGIKHYGEPKQNELYKGRKIDIKFNGSLREYQEPIANLIQNSFSTIGGGIVSLPCGRGKTVVAIEAIVRLGVKTLVIAHKDFLIRQWIRQIKRWTNAKVGVIQRDVVDIDDKDIVVGMLMSISIKDYKESIFSQFGLVVVDECHHIAARVYSRSLPKTTCRYTLGLSATPIRSDGLTKVFYWFLGDMIYKEDLRQNNQVHAHVYNYTSNHNLFKPILNWKTKNPIKETMVSNLTQIPERTQLIIKLINQRRKRGTFCKILVLSRRRDHLDEMKKIIDNVIKDENKVLKKLYIIKKHLKRIITLNEKMKKNTKKFKQHLDVVYDIIDIQEKHCVHKTGFYVGGMKEDDLKESEEKDIIFATFNMCEEGLDIPALNTVVFATPKPNVVQSAGRILRLENYDIAPEIIDINDQLSLFKGFGNSREKYYIKSKYHLHKYNVENENITKISYCDTSKMAPEKQYVKATPMNILKMIDDNLD